MLSQRYKNIVIIGYGVIANDVLEYVHQHYFNYNISYIEYEHYPFNRAAKYAVACNIPFFSVTTKEEVLEVFSKINKTGRTLIISANNNYLFPESLINNNSLRIINFHNALLPNYPGRNAPSWAIFNDEKKTGITWHYVDSGIDTGSIIIQKTTEISKDIKAYELVSILMQLAMQAFVEVIDNIVNDTVEAEKQLTINNRRIYKSYEVPGDGRFDLNADPSYIYKLLRATDYGKNDIFPKIRTVINNQNVFIKRYKIVETDMSSMEDNIVCLAYDESYLYLKYSL